jgi:hypothetical protein
VLSSRPHVACQEVRTEIVRVSLGWTRQQSWKFALQAWRATSHLTKVLCDHAIPFEEQQRVCRWHYTWPGCALHQMAPSLRESPKQSAQPFASATGWMLHQGRARHESKEVRPSLTVVNVVFLCRRQQTCTDRCHIGAKPWMVRGCVVCTHVHHGQSYQMCPRQKEVGRRTFPPCTWVGRQLRGGVNHALQAVHQFVCRISKTRPTIGWACAFAGRTFANKTTGAKHKFLFWTKNALAKKGAAVVGRGPTKTTGEFQPCCFGGLEVATEWKFCRVKTTFEPF